MSNFREHKVTSEPPSSEIPSERPIPVTMIFWVVIILLSLIISLFAALAVEWWGKTSDENSSLPAPLLAIPQPTTDTQTKSPEASTPEPIQQPAIPSAPIAWKEIAQQLRQSEELKLEVLTNTLKKLPELAPLPRIEATEPPVTVPKIEPTISWKILSSQLERVEQQQREMLQKLFEKQGKWELIEIKTFSQREFL